jgi:hypothetical protein
MLSTNFIMSDAPNIPGIRVIGPFAGEYFYSRNLYGPYSGTLSEGNLPSGKGAMLEWEVVSAIIAVWKTLDSIERTSWERISKRQKISNYNAFMQVNMKRAMQDEPTIRTPT